VVLFPRRREERAPAFQTLAEGKIIQIRGDFGMDHVFVAAHEQTATADGIAFLGTAASVQDRPGGLLLALGARGEVGCREYRLLAGGAASLHVAPATLTVEAAGTGKVVITAPGAWVLEDQRPNIALAREGNRLVLSLPAGVGPVKLRAR